MTEHGLSNEELERQLQEEEKGLEQQEPTPQTTIEISNEELGKEIDLESNKAESNEKILEQNLINIGGEEGVEKTWSTLDKMEQDSILRRIKTYSEDKKSVIEEQKMAASGLNPIMVIKGVSASMGDGNDPFAVIGKVTGGLIGAGLYASGIAPSAMLIKLAKNTAERVHMALKINKQKRELSKLEQKYAA